MARCFFSFCLLLSFASYASDLLELVEQARKESLLLDMRDLEGAHDSCGIVASTHMASFTKAFRENAPIEINLRTAEKLHEKVPCEMKNSQVLDSIRMTFADLDLEPPVFGGAKVLRKSVLDKKVEGVDLDLAFDYEDLESLRANKALLYIVSSAYSSSGTKLFTHGIIAVKQEGRLLHVVDPDEAKTPVQYVVSKLSLEIEGVTSSTLVLFPRSKSMLDRDRDLSVRFLLPIMLVPVVLED